MNQHDKSKMKVYIVEDQALLRQTLRASLEFEGGIEVAADAGDAEQALEDLEHLDIDVVLMDIQLPGIDGIEAIRTLKEKRPELPVVALTGHGDAYFEQAFSAGATSYVPKSCTREQLVEAVRAAQRGQAIIDAQLAGKLVRELIDLRQTQRETLLTPRQVEVLQMVAHGSKYREIASALFLNERTVHREMRSIFDRLGVDDASHAVYEAYKNRII